MQINAGFSEQLAAVLKELTSEQIRFVITRQEYSSDKDAAEAMGLKPNTVYHWPDTVRDAVKLMAADGLIVAQHIRRRNLAKAMMVKVAGLDSKDERIRQNAATEIIEWEMGKAAQVADIIIHDEPNFDSWDETELDTFIRLVSKAIREGETDESA